MADQATQILQEAIEAHGGIEYWNSLSALEVEISARGFLFTAKRRPVLRRVIMRASTREPRFTMHDFPKQGQAAEMTGDDAVRIISRDGRTLARRESPRSAFRGNRRLFWWDDLDFTYFCSYATWNYLTAPFLLARRGFLLEELDPVQSAFGRLVRVQATFPTDIPTHSRVQTFYFDDRRLLRRLDYTAEVVGGWASAAHFCDEYRTFGRLVVPTRRRVLPLFSRRNPLPGPTLVALDVHDVRPIAG